MLFKLFICFSVLATVATHVAAAATLPSTFANDTLPTNSSTLTKRMFSYHDNSFFFTINTNVLYNLRINDFVITDLFVTPGQDPDNINKVGDVHPVTGPKNEMWFSVGRHRSKETANWWTKRFQSIETSFNHVPGSLNFAFIGDLRCTIYHDRDPIPFVVHNVGFAQGHNYYSNNWWLGIQKSKWYSANVLSIAVPEVNVTLIMARGLLYAGDGQDRAVNEYVVDLTY